MADQSTPTIQQKGGLVGIGASNPVSKLQVQDGDIRLQTSGGNPSVIFGSYGISTSYPQGSIVLSDGGGYGGNFDFYTKDNGSPTNPLNLVMSITYNSRVGIGVASPSYKLDVRGTSTILGLISTDGTPTRLIIQRSTVPLFLTDMYTAATTAGASWSINKADTSAGSSTWSSSTNVSYASAAIRLNADTATSYITFLTASAVNTNPSEVVRITGAGNVGINTVSPNAELDVYTTQGGSRIAATHGVGGAYPKASGISFGATSTSLSVSNNGGTTVFTGGAGIYAANSAASNNPTDLVFWTTAAGSPTERMRISSSGQLRFNAYTSSSSFTGTAAGVLAFDSSGNIITQSATLYPSGSGTTNYVTKWTGANTLGNSLIFDNGSNVFIGATSNAFGLLDLTVSPSSYTAALGIGNITPASEGQSTGISFKHRIALDNNVREGARIAAISELVTASAYQSLAFYTMNTTTLAERMRILYNGNVGIGVTIPSANLQINRSSQQTDVDNASQVLALLNTSTDTAGNLSGIRFRQENGTNAGQGFIGLSSTGSVSTRAAMVFAAPNTSGNAVERMRITSGGIVQVGQGVSNDGDTRYVQIQGSGTTAAALELINYWNGTAYTAGVYGGKGSNAAANLTFKVAFFNGSAAQQRDAMFIDESGNVGIGTTSPAQLLSVEGSTTEVLSVGTSAQKLYFRPDGSGVMLSTATGQAGEGIYFGNSSDFMYFQTASAERMRITSGGNVGIGTSSPDAIFHVAKSTSGGVGGQIVIDNPAGSALGNTAELSFLTDAGASGTGTRNARILAVNENVSNGAARLEFHVWSGSVSAERLRISSDGVITQFLSTGAAAFGNGINISTQQGTYTSGHGGILQFQNEDVITAGIRGIRTTGWGSAMLFYVHNESAGNTFGTTFVERMRITETGEIWMGYTTDQGAYLLQVNGSVYATAYYESSDIRLKDVVSTRNSTTFGAIQYTWKDGRDDKMHWGYSAQEVMKWIPDAIQENKDGYYTLDYNQAHTYKIAMLEDRVAELEQELKQLKNK